MPKLRQRRGRVASITGAEIVGKSKRTERGQRARPHRPGLSKDYGKENGEHCTFLE